MTGAATQGVLTDRLIGPGGDVADLVSADAQTIAARLLGVSAVLAFRPDDAEWHRRGQVGLGALDSSDHLDVLLSLPIGLPVPVVELSPRERRQLAKLPAGAVAICSGDVVRLAVSPLRVELAIVPARGWVKGLELAGRFAPFAARVMWLPRLPEAQDDMRMLARRYGVGVVVGEPDRAQVAVAPAPFVRRRFSAAGWLFTERVFERAARHWLPPPA